jgi:hypothetical protein
MDEVIVLTQEQKARTRPKRNARIAIASRFVVVMVRCPGEEREHH